MNQPIENPKHIQSRFQAPLGGTAAAALPKILLTENLILGTGLLIVKWICLYWSRTVSNIEGSNQLLSEKSYMCSKPSCQFSEEKEKTQMERQPPHSSSSELNMVSAEPR